MSGLLVYPVQVVYQVDNCVALLSHCGTQITEWCPMIVLQESSRSHAVFTIIVEHATYDGSGGNTVTIGKLRLVDLAGAEK